MQYQTSHCDMLSKKPANTKTSVQKAATIFTYNDNSLLVHTANWHLPPPLKNALRVLIYRESDGLSRGNTHHSRRDTLVEASRSFCFPHIRSNVHNARDG